MMAVAGGLGMSESEFWRTSLRYLYNRLEGYQKMREMESRERYEVARYMAAITVGPHVKKGAIKRLTDLGEFPWEISERKPIDTKRIEDLKEKLEAKLASGGIEWQPVSSMDLIQGK